MAFLKNLIVQSLASHQTHYFIEEVTKLFHFEVLIAFFLHLE